MNHSRLLFLLLIAGPMLAGAARAQCPEGTPAEGDFRSRITGDWNSPATWDRYESGVWVDQGTDIDGTTPGASLITETTTICNADVVTVNGSITLGGPFVVDTTATLHVGDFDTFTTEGAVTNHGGVTGGISATFAFNGLVQVLSGHGTWEGTGLTLRADTGLDGTIVTLAHDLTVRTNVKTLAGGTFDVGGFNLTVDGTIGTLTITNDGAFSGSGAVVTLGDVHIDLDGAGGGVFSAPFRVSGDITTAIPSGRTAGAFTVDPGATLMVDAFDTFTVEGDVLNNGTITGGSASIFAFGGAGQSLSGSGAWTSTSLTARVDGGASVSLAGDITMGSNLSVSAGGTADPGGFTWTVSGDGSTPKITNDGTVSGAGVVRTSGTVDIDLDGGGAGVFSALLEVFDGTTTAIPTGRTAGPVTVDAGATLTVDAFDSFTVEGDVLNNGIITGGSASIFAFGGAGQSLSGTGAWTSTGLTARVDNGASVSLAGSVSMGVDLTVEDGGTLALGTFDLTYDGNAIEPALSNNGMVTGTGFFRTTGAVELDPDGGGTGVFLAPIRVVDSTATAIPTGRLAGSLTVDAGATLTVDAFDSFTVEGDVINNGTITGGAATIFAFGGAGQSLSGGGVWQGSSLSTRIDSAAVVTLGNDVTYAAGLTTDADAELSLGGHTFTLSGVTFTHNGRLSGTGTLDYAAGTFVQNGTIAPGLSSGIVTLDGDYDHNGGVFDLSLDSGTTPGTGHDQVAVTGAGTLTGGTLDVSIAHDYFPNVGDQFTLVTCGGGCSGAFDAVNPPPGYGVSTTVNANDVVLEVTAVPPLGVSVTPVAPPIVIPPTGGSFDYDLFIINQSAVAQTFDVWIRISQGAAGKRLGPVTRNLAPGASLSRTLTQVIPAGVPSGTFTLTANVGTFPGTIDDSDSFTFVKEVTAGPEQSVAGGWESALRGDGALSVAVAAEGPAPVAAGVSADVPAEYALAQNYPNPFNPQTVIRYALPEAGPVTLQVYNVLGQRVATLVNEAMPAGRYAVTFDASGLAAGVYLYRLRAGAFTATRQLTLLK